MAEQASFTPLVFSCTGGASKLTTTFLKKLSSMISEESETPYTVSLFAGFVVVWLLLY